MKDAVIKQGRKDAGQVQTTDVRGADFPKRCLYYECSFSFNLLHNI